MYISKLILNQKTNQVRRELSAPYQMHKTLLRAFPDQVDGGAGKVLFRFETLRDVGMVQLLVQSEKEPKWQRLLERHPKYLADEPAQKPFSPSFAKGQRLLFRLRANPTYKKDKKRQAHLTEGKQREWIERKAKSGGFDIHGLRIIPEGMRKDTTGKESGDISLYSVLYEGILTVSDPEIFMQTIRQGLGSAKGMGFGLLSVAPG